MALFKAGRVLLPSSSWPPMAKGNGKVTHARPSEPPDNPARTMSLPQSPTETCPSSGPTAVSSQEKRRQPLVGMDGLDTNEGEAVTLSE